MFGTPMPKATINKNSHLFAFEHEVRFARQFLLTTPTFDPVVPEQSNKSQLGRLVSS